jgi:hypothetical protein
MYRKFKILFAVVTLVFIAAYAIANLNLMGRHVFKLQSCEPISDWRLHDNEISLKLPVGEVYRLDISCDFITKDLGARVNEKYKNAKQCSLSSLNKDLDQVLTGSFTAEHVPAYRPQLQSNNVKMLNASGMGIRLGGFWAPEFKPNSVCNRDNIDFIIFIVPYLNRPENLNLLLNNLHSYLVSVRYKVSYGILVAEQANHDKKFNKGQLINTAVNYALNTYKTVDCIVLHDVDLVPLVNDSTVDYRCRQMPLHMTRNVLILKTAWNRVYNQFLTGGVLSLRPQHFVDANGFSNSYRGWGGKLYTNSFKTILLVFLNFFFSAGEDDVSDRLLFSSLLRRFPRYLHF